uniref:Uncharacterized protein n=1 Tax=Setaria italica TaxID=4555 RepID=K3ZNU9_SETIT
EAFDSDFESQTETDSSDDRRHRPRVPFPHGDALRVYCHADNTYRCPICPTRIHWSKILNEVKDHVLGMARSAALRGDNKKWRCHRVVARNEGWM